MSDESGCLACDLIDGRQELPGGRIDETRHWVVEHCVGPLSVGALIVKPLRHVVHVADLTAEESAELGPLLQRTSAALTELTAPEQIYVTLWSHAGGVPGHIHFVVQPVHKPEMERHGRYGPALQVAMFATGEHPGPDEVRAFADRMRAHLQVGHGA
ncbi:HIT family protein [Actinoplanes aureus]|uniref:HIT family protein n=1 Tax=Actinoplanes aureus TaxID=2792083 RepID=A0A931CBS9_9ACTN|nr:HIT family protein [Actinoplanes aureus]MBG0565082.1 HIT family protein [Actinoplanes aureus]